MSRRDIRRGARAGNHRGQGNLLVWQAEKEARRRIPSLPTRAEQDTRRLLESETPSLLQGLEKFVAILELFPWRGTSIGEGRERARNAVYRNESLRRVQCGRGR
jgi:hypothetical protein